MADTVYFNDLRQIEDLQRLSEAQRRRVAAVEGKYHFRSNSYYQSLINWNDPDDPIRRAVIPHEDELIEWGQLDPSGEADYAAAPGLEHKYGDTALLLASNVCGAQCRFCFRKRLFMEGNREVSRDLTQALAYIRAHGEISNVLVTGGDPLLLPTPRLREIVSELCAIDHVKIIRIGSKMPAFDPHRILEDPELLQLFADYSSGPKRLYLMAHFNHLQELTPQALEAIDRVQKSGAVVMNQTPLIRGLNDDPQALGALLDTLVTLGVNPYYVFQCRPTRGNLAYTVPLEEAYQIYRDALRRCSGLSRRVRFTMSHRSGKIEIVGLNDDFVFFRYHRAADPANEGRMIIAPRNPEGYWFDDYEELCLSGYKEAADF